MLLTPLFPALTSPLWRARVGAIVYIALASMVPTTAYAVAVSQVLDLHLVIRRTLQYGLAKTSVWCAILLPLLYLLFDIYNNRSLRVEEYLTVRRPSRASSAVAGQLWHPDVPSSDSAVRRSVVQSRRQRSHGVAGEAGTGTSIGADDPRHLGHPEARNRARPSSFVGRGADG